MLRDERIIHRLSANHRSVLSRTEGRQLVNVRTRSRYRVLLSAPHSLPEHKSAASEGSIRFTAIEIAGGFIEKMEHCTEV